MPDPVVILIIILVFVLAGTVKGIIGLGLPSVSLALLSVAIELPSAMALLLVPSLVTNVWQMLDGNDTWNVFKRIWRFLAMATLSVWIGALALGRLELHLLSVLLGSLLIAYAALGLTGLRLTLSKTKERYAGPLLGMLNGVLTGMTGSFVVPGVMYLQSINLSRNSLVQAMGMLFTASTIALALALKGNGFLNPELGLLSALGVVPALVGMYIGRHLRQRLSENGFRRAFFIALLVLGGYIIWSNITL